MVSDGVSTFTFGGVAVDIVPHHCGCWLWPCSELWLHTVEKEREILATSGEIFVSSPDQTHIMGKGLVTFEQFLGCANSAFK